MKPRSVGCNSTPGKQAAYESLTKGCGLPFFCYPTIRDGETQVPITLAVTIIAALPNVKR